MSPLDRRRGIPFVVAAPSGTGKTSVCRLVVAGDDRVCFSISHTTRKLREGEVDGKDYHFVSPAEFQRLFDAGVFLESADYNGSRYGTSWQSVEAPIAEGRDVLLEIEVQGARQVRARREGACLIFLRPPSMEALKQRLTGRRTDTEEEISKRLELARKELEAIAEFHYVVTNDDLDRCVASVEEIIRAERAGDCEEVRGRYAAAP